MADLAHGTLPAGGGTGLQSRTYQLVPVDLRRSPHETLDSTLAAIDDQGAPLLSPSLPTLLLFECVLVYMSPEASSALFQWFVDYLSTGQQAILGSVVYEMFGLNDPFGRMMVNNLKVCLSSRKGKLDSRAFRLGMLLYLVPSRTPTKRLFLDASHSTVLAHHMP